MTMTPEDVQATRFREGWRGYDEGEVDDFMSRVAHALQVAITEREDAVARAERLAAEADGVHESERLLQRTLLTAERTAEETVARAEAEAEQLLSDARAEAERIRIEAHDRGRAQIRRAAETTEQVRRAVADFRAFRDEYAGRIEELVAEQLRALDAIGRIPDLPEALAGFADFAVDEDDSGSAGADGDATAGAAGVSVLDLEPPLAPAAGQAEAQAGGEHDPA